MLAAIYSAIRRLVSQSPTYLLSATLSLALGIATTTVAFEAIERLVFRTLPVRNAKDLVFFYQPGPLEGNITTEESGEPSFSYPLFRVLQRDLHSFEGVAGASYLNTNLRFQNNAGAGRIRLVSGNYFDVLGVPPEVGRIITVADEERNVQPVAVLSFDAWIKYCEGSTAILNHAIYINGFPVTVVGVSARGFQSEQIGAPPDVYVPLTIKPLISAGWNGLDDRRHHWVTILGRLAPEISIQAAEQRINVLYSAEVRTDAELLHHPTPDLLKRFLSKRIILRPGARGRGDVRSAVRGPLLLVSAIAVLVLLVACANVANLELAYYTGRLREFAIRFSLGATRWKIAKLLLFEASISTVAGGVLGLLLSRAAIAYIASVLPSSVGVQKMLLSPLSSREVTFAVALTFVIVVAVAVIPISQLSERRFLTWANASAGQLSGSRKVRLLRNGIASIQIALALVLLVAAGLFAKSLKQLHSIQLGIESEHLSTLSLAPALNGYSVGRTLQLIDDLRSRVAELPGVVSVSVADTPILAHSISGSYIHLLGYVASTEDGSFPSYTDAVDVEYFHTVGIPLVAGRAFASSDGRAAPKVAVVNQAFVRKYSPGQSVLGRRLGSAGGDRVNFDTTIVGVVGDAKYDSLKDPAPPVFYRPLTQSTRLPSIYFYLRVQSGFDGIALAINREIAALDPTLPVREFKTMYSQVSSNMFAERGMTVVTTGFGLLATILAALGIYSVLSFQVASQTREIGLRIAIGAPLRHIRYFVLKRILRILGVGSVIGLVVVRIMGAAIQSFLYNVSASDVWVYFGATTIIWCVGLFAAYSPTRRAIAISPIAAMRLDDIR